MRFVVTGEWSKNAVLRLILFMFMVFMVLFWITVVFTYYGKGMTLDPDTVVSYFCGSEDSSSASDPVADPLPIVGDDSSDEEWTRDQGRPFSAMAETSHVHLFTMGMLVMVLTHLLLFVPLASRWKVIWILLTFVSTLFNEISNWLVRYVHPSFAWLKVSSFVLMQLSLLGLIVLLGVYLLKPRRNAYTDTTQKSA